LHRTPEAICDHSDRGGANFSHETNAGDTLGIAVIEAGDFAANHRTSRQQRILHIGDAHIDPKFRRTLHLGGRVDPGRSGMNPPR